MMGMSRRLAAVCAVAILATLATGCGASKSDSGSKGAVKVVAILDRTGTAGYGGELEAKAIELGIKQLNQSGGRKIDLEVKDSGSNLNQAVNLVNEATRSDADLIMYGPWSATTLALAPIAQRAKVPFVALQSGVAGVVETGDYIFRITTPQSLFLGSLYDYLGEQGVKKVASFYLSDSATIKELGEKIMPPLAKARGMEYSQVGTVTVTQTDFKAIADKIIAARPDAVFMGTSGTQNVTAISQLRRAGFDGIIFGSGGFAGGVLDPLKAEADKIVYPEWFSAKTTLPVGKKFVADYEKAYGKVPLTFAGEAFDATLLLKHALGKIEGEVTRETMKAALTAVTAEGFAGAQGEPLTFDGRDARGGGFIVRRDKGTDTIVKSPKTT